ncbi:WbqC family protein, partial [Patescibacteria group bacterium]
MWATIHQPLYLPYSGFFNKIKETDIFIIFDKCGFK